MPNRMHLEALLGATATDQVGRLSLLGIVGLGIVESLGNGSMSASDAARDFFNADNCLYVKDRLGERAASEFMSRGVQLPDLFDALPVEEAQREFLHELAAMRALCLRLVETGRRVA